MANKAMSERARVLERRARQLELRSLGLFRARVIEILISEFGCTPDDVDKDWNRRDKWSVSDTPRPEKIWARRSRGFERYMRQAPEPEGASSKADSPAF